jgi:hypothetical protein
VDVRAQIAGHRIYRLVFLFNADGETGTHDRLPSINVARAPPPAKSSGYTDASGWTRVPVPLGCGVVVQLEHSPFLCSCAGVKSRTETLLNGGQQEEMKWSFRS